MKIFIIPMDVTGHGWIEVIAESEEKAIKKVKDGLGVQHCDEWQCDNYYIDDISDGEEVGEGDIAEYKLESGEKEL